MILIAIPLILLILGLTVLWKDPRHDEPVGAACAIIGGAVLFMVVVFGLIAIRDTNKKAYANYNEIAPILKMIDEKEDEALSLAIRMYLKTTINEINKEIEDAKNYNDGIFDIYLYDKTATLEPIK